MLARAPVLGGSEHRDVDLDLGPVGRVRDYPDPTSPGGPPGRAFADAGTAAGIVRDLDRFPARDGPGQGLAHRKADATERPDLKRPRTQPGAPSRLHDKALVLTVSATPKPLSLSAKCWMATDSCIWGS